VALGSVRTFCGSAFAASAPDSQVTRVDKDYYVSYTLSLLRLFAESHSQTSALSRLYSLAAWYRRSLTTCQRRLAFGIQPETLITSQFTQQYSSIAVIYRFPSVVQNSRIEAATKLFLTTNGHISITVHGLL